MNKGKFIVLEGLDGSGKSTQTKILTTSLNRNNIKCVATAEPTKDGILSKHIADVLSGVVHADMHFQAALFFADRLEHLLNRENGIIKYLEDGYFVVCDRYYYSSFAYQGLEVERKWLIDLHLNCKLALKPDLCIFLDAEPATCAERILRKRKQIDIYEEKNVMKSIRQNFLEIFDFFGDSHNIKVINARHSQQEVAHSIWSEIIDLI